MKFLKPIVLLITVCVFLSCGNNSKTNVHNVAGSHNSDGDNENIAANLEKISLGIDGMTCEIGCARTIQSKLSKTKGVKMAEVNFENKRGVVEFDSNRITEDEIVDIVEQIAGGDLYKVIEVKKAE
ncbi:heavy-metal-associated domain-containing protein [Aureibaculum sp. A20]|uniref:Heavy-metal-associated domain-containing protein n=1 Tax=Aureibaculum flavum TaxID=2795986 RepID=A0ABS0WRY9_9FLAO|nr:heavy-metal-associated domain-containing protein [Aureibaculum flavum]MBJ2174744.1 heavy-metal-associated domain-containing protein [Aureibaculum flavum]